MKIHAKTPFLLCNNDVSQICEPLFNSSVIDYFEMQQYHSDGRFISLTNKPQLTKIYLENEIYVTNEELSKTIGNNQSIIAIFSKDIYQKTSYQEGKALKNISIGCELDIYHRIYIIQKRLAYFNLFGFGCCSDLPQIISIMMSNIDVLIKFGKYFEDNSLSLIDFSNENPIYLPNFNKIKYIQDAEVLFERDKIEKVLNANYLLSAKNKLSNNAVQKNISRLSKREYECINLIVQGYTAKESAKILGLSHRTIEEYIIRIKNKLGCSTRHELISIFMKSI